MADAMNLEDFMPLIPLLILVFLIMAAAWAYMVSGPRQ